MRLFTVVVAAALVGACAQTRLAVHTAKQVAGSLESSAPSAPLAVATGVDSPTYKVGDPYQVGSVWYTPREDPDYEQTGIASWYGVPFHGRTTANGEVYDMNALTSAHKTLPMPTTVRVTNLQNGRSLVLRVNDRGPFVNGRIIDVSRRAAQLLGFVRQGTARVRVSAIQSKSERYVGRRPETSEEERREIAAVPIVPVRGQRLAPPAGVSVAPATPQQRPSIVSREAVKETRMYVQAGAFVQQANAQVLASRLASLGSAQITTSTVKGQRFYRVRIGPLESVEEADVALARVIGGGHSGARIVVD